MNYPSTLIPDFFKNITLPTYGVEINEIRGWEERKNYNKSGINAKIELVYLERTASEIETLLQFYNLTKGSFHAFTVPLDIWRHPNIYINELANSLPFIHWVFDNKINIITKKLDVYDFNVSLRSVPAVSEEPLPSFPDIII